MLTIISHQKGHFQISLWRSLPGPVLFVAASFLLGVLATGFPAGAASLGPAFTIYDGATTIDYLTEDTTAVPVAYSPHANRFLVVWRSNVTSSYNLWCRFVDQNGTLAGEPLLLNPGGGNGGQPVYDPVHQRFLVFWGYSDNKCHARFVHPETGLGAETFTYPSVGLGGVSKAVYDSVNNRFFVLYGSLGRQLKGLLIGPDGVQLGDPFTVVNLDLEPAVGLEWIADNTIAFDSNNGRFLVAYCGKKLSSPYWAVHARIINADGTPYKGDFLVKDHSSALSDVVFDALNSRFLALWDTSGSPPEYDKGQLINADGTLYGGPLPIMELGGIFYQKAAFDPVNRRFILVAKDSWFPRIIGQTLDLAGNAVGSPYTITEESSGAWPFISWSTSGSLIIWNQIGSTDTFGVFGRMMDVKLPSKKGYIAPWLNLLF